MRTIRPAFTCQAAWPETATALFEELADAVAEVEGSRLPLHSQVLAARSAVLRSTLLERAGDATVPAQVGGHGHGGAIVSSCLLHPVALACRVAGH